MSIIFVQLLLLCIYRVIFAYIFSILLITTMCGLLYAKKFRLPYFIFIFELYKYSCNKCHCGNPFRGPVGLLPLSFENGFVFTVRACNCKKVCKNPAGKQICVTSSLRTCFSIEVYKNAITSNKKRIKNHNPLSTDSLACMWPLSWMGRIRNTLDTTCK